RILRSWCEPPRRLFHFTSARISIAQQSRRAVVVKFHVGTCHPLQVRNRSRIVSQSQCALRTPVVAVQGIGSRRVRFACSVGFDRFRERFSRLRILFFFQVQFAQLLVIPRRRIVQNLQFQLLHPRTPPKALENSAQQ